MSALTPPPAPPQSVKALHDQRLPLVAGPKHLQIHPLAAPPANIDPTLASTREAQMAKEQRSTKEKRKPKKDAGDKKGAKK
jgi:hypothetical protein